MSWLIGWSYQKQITIQYANVDDNEDNFPLYVEINADADIGIHALANGHDIRFTESDGETLLKYERESFVIAAGIASGHFWVKVPIITTASGVKIYIYYGNTGAIDGADPTDVWDSYFRAVYHLKDLTTSTIADSTVNANNGTKKGANEPIEANGIIWKAQDFDGVDDYINTIFPTIRTDILGAGYPGIGHVQGIATDGIYFWVTFTTKLIKYDNNWNELDAADLIAHAGDPCYYDGKIYVPTCNYPTTPAINSVEIYNANSLVFIESINLPDLPTHNSSIAFDGTYFWVSTYNLNPDEIYKYNQNFVYQGMVISLGRNGVQGIMFHNGKLYSIANDMYIWEYINFVHIDQFQIDAEQGLAAYGDRIYSGSSGANRIYITQLLSILHSSLTISFSINIPYLIADIPEAFMRLICLNQDHQSIYYAKNDKLYFKLTTTEGSLPRPAINGGDLLQNQWMRIAAVYDHDKAYLYLNGELKSTVDRDNTDCIYGTSFNYYRLGSDVYKYKGLLDEVRISSIDRSAAWIKFESRNIIEADHELIWGEERIYVSAFEEFASLPDLEKLVIVEIQPRKEIQNNDWIYDILSEITIYGTSFLWGEPVRVTENAIDYYRQNTKDDCFAVAGSYWFDEENKYLWIHTSDGDAPNEILSGSVSGAGGNKYCILVYFWICLTNYQPKSPSDDTPIIDYIPQDAILPVYYLPYLPGDALGSVRQAIGEYHIGDVIINDADLKCNNDGFWYKVINECYLENAIIEAKVGDIRASYAELALFFTGFIRNKDVTDEQISFSCKDRRMGRFREIPELRFDRTTYPQLEEGADGRVIPIPLGRCYGCNPTYIGQPAPGQWAYKPSAVQINALTVYRDGVLLVLGADYNEDLVNGVFALLADPLDSLITCDMEGVLCDMTTGLYSANIADLLYYLLVNLNDIPATEIDVASFLALKAARGQTCGYWLGGDGNSIHTLDVLRLFQVTGMFHLVPNLANLFEVRWFETGSDSFTPIFYQDEFPLIGRRLDADRIRQKVVVNYRYNHSIQEWLSVEAVADKTIYRFSEHEVQTIDTALVVQAEAESLAALHLDLLRFPGDFAFGQLPARSLNMLPAEKIILNKLIVMETGEAIPVFRDAIYRLFSLDKNLETGESEIVAINESQATGQYHADVLHVDSYLDIPHGDGHGDVHVDSHGDEHEDEYWDEPHLDTHEDVGHIDHEDGAPYFDVPHQDSHGDQRYMDYYLDLHNDQHVDEYSDSPHQDYLHIDSYQDIPHSDAEY